MKLGILDLLQPQFSLGVIIPNLNGTILQRLPDTPGSILGNLTESVHDFLNFISIEEIHTAFDDTAIVYSGKAQFGGDGLAVSPPTYSTPSGSLIDVGDFSFIFRLTIPRRGSAAINTSLTSSVNGLNDNAKVDLQDLQNMLNLLGSTGVSANPSDYPNRDFRLELMFNTIKLHLPPDSFYPAKLNNNGWLERDPAFQEVVFELPKIAMVVEQGQDNYNTTQVRFEGWGVNSFEDVNDNAAGELISMKPPLCLHKSGIIGFGLEKVVLDLSNEFTPPEILEKNFGVGDEFQGLWLPSVRLFFAPAGIRGFAFDTWAQDMLIDFDRGVSGEFGIEIINGAAVNKVLEVRVVGYQGQTRREVTKTGSDEQVENNLTRRSRVSIAANGEFQIDVRGGRPPYTISIKKLSGHAANINTVKNTGAVITPQPYNGDARRLRYPIGETAAGNWSFLVEVMDFPLNTRKWTELVRAQLLNPASITTTSTVINDPVIENQSATQPGYQIVLADSQPDNEAIFVKVVPDTADSLLSGSTSFTKNSEGIYRIPAARNGAAHHLVATWSGTSLPVIQPSQPLGAIQTTRPANFEYLGDSLDTLGNDVPSQAEMTTKLAALLRDSNVTQKWIDFKNRAGSQTINIYGYASYESHNSSNINHNIELSDRRARLLVSLLTNPAIGVPASQINYPPLTIRPTDANYTTDSIHAKGFFVDKYDNSATGSTYWVAIAFFTGNTGAITSQADVKRPQDTTRSTTSISSAEPAPAPKEPGRPPLFRKAHIKIRLQRNELVFAELSGQLDIDTQAEASARTIQNNTTDGTNNGATNISNAITTTPQASESEEQGILDFRISMVFDKATRKLTQVLEVGFDKNNSRNGFVHLNKFAPEALANTTASLLLFAPLIQATGIEAIQSAENDNQRIAAIALATAEVGLATMLGIAAIKMERITLFDVQLTFTESSPDIWLWNATSFDEIGFLFDYSVDFRLDLNIFDFIRIKTRQTGTNNQTLAPPRARYKAIGFKLNFEKDNFDYIPVFDTSKGYELSLGDPGALQVLVAGQDIGNLLKVLTARLARENPFLLELDLALNVNLGIITVDNIRVTVRINNNVNPADVKISVIPTKVSVNIPATLVGTGYFNMGNGGGTSLPGANGGFSGFVDVTLVPLKLRIAASLGIAPLSKEGRQVTSFFLGLEVELPAAIPLANTGLGIYGFLGLFGMHYKRKEPADVAGQLPPALRWFDEVVHGNVIDINGWEPNIDRWSFGLGIILGTMEGGFVFNLKGMLMLELPGPRILIFVKAQLLIPRPPGVKNEGNAKSLGILAVIDLNFHIGRLTIGLIIQYEIESILSLRVPVDAQFNFTDPSKWHLYLGSNKLPAEAKILGIAKGYAYLMFSGDGIDDFPETGQRILNGFSIALGIGASLILGDRDSGLYLEVGGDMKAGISFSPLHLYGKIQLHGALHLWAISISARASLEAEAIMQNGNFLTRIEGEACGKVSFFFFDIEGCVRITIGPDKLDFPEPHKLINGMALVSRSPALTEGQGVDKPIDGALGDAMEITGVIDESLVPVVPIDAVPVLNLFATPLRSTALNSFVTIDNIATLGWVDAGANETFVQYTLNKLTIDQPLIDNTLPKSAKWWKKVNNENGNETGIDLALLAWMPNPTPRAIQLSQQLIDNVDREWGTVCREIAPITSVLWTFRNKPLGYSPNGWNLTGVMWPDPAGKQRSGKPDLEIFVHEMPQPFEHPQYEYLQQTARGISTEHAKVISLPQQSGNALQLPFDHFAEKQERPVQVSDSMLAALKNHLTERIIIETGEIVSANLLVALNFHVIDKIEELYVITYDSDNKVIKEALAKDYGMIVISALSDLPPRWFDAGGPWLKDVTAVFNFLNSLSKTVKIVTFLIPYKGEKNMHHIELLVRRNRKQQLPPACLLGIIETTTKAETERYDYDITDKNTSIQIIESALAGEQLRPLFRPNTRYTISAEYSYSLKYKNEIVKTDIVKQNYVFKTDNKLPRRLDPWVLATTPQNDHMYHFADDAVQIFFNDGSFEQLFRAYGFTLKSKLRKANGNHPAEDADKMILKPSNLKGIAAALKTPFLTALNIVASDLVCVNKSGKSEDHKVFTIPIPLQCNTAYTLEVELNPQPVRDPLEKNPLMPLFKLAFTTSRFRNAQELASIIRNSKITTRVLKAPLTDLASVTNENAMQDALMASGLEALPPSENPSVIIFWVKQGVGFVASAILIDSPEPLWRERPFPHLETINAQSGNMQHWIVENKPEFEIIEKGSASVQKFVHTEGGGRTLVYLKNSVAGQDLILKWQRHKFTVDENAYADVANLVEFEILNIKIPAKAPWEIEE